MTVNVTPHYSLEIFETPRHKDVNYISKLQVQNKSMYFPCSKTEYTLYCHREGVYQ